jgi:hypothetical protein
MNIIYFSLYVFFVIFAGLLAGDTTICEHGFVIDRPFWAIFVIYTLMVVPFIKYKKDDSE